MSNNTRAFLDMVQLYFAFKLILLLFCNLLSCQCCTVFVVLSYNIVIFLLHHCVNTIGVVSIASY